VTAATRWVALALVSLIALAGCDLRTAGAKKGDLTLVTTFDDAQHLVPGHAVKVADVTVGSITKVALDGYRAQVTMSIADGQRIPEGTVAVLGQTSLLGENYVRLQFPEHFDVANGPFLGDGDEIATSDVDPALEHVAQRALEVLSAIQANDLAAIVAAGAEGLGGRGDELHALIGQLAELGTALASESDELGAAVDGFGALGRSLADGAGELGALIDSLAGASETLGTQRDRIVDTVAKLTDLARALNDAVLVPHGQQLQIMLAQLDPIVATLAADRETVGQLLANVAVLAARAPHAIEDGKVLLYAWIDSIRMPDGTIMPINLSGAAAVANLLQPPGAEGSS